MRVFRRLRLRREVSGDGAHRDGPVAVEGHRERDQRVLAALAEHGADVGQPRHVLYYLYARDPESAARAGAVARERGFATTLSEPLPGYPGQWPLRCELDQAVLTADVVRANSTFFLDLAARFGLEYDGWEASV